MALTGKPANLSTNCAKHILAEAKHAHVYHVARQVELGRNRQVAVNKRFPDLESIDQVRPPPWTPALLNNMLAGAKCDSDAGVAADESDDGEGVDISVAGSLLDIDRGLEVVASRQQSQSRARSNGRKHVCKDDIMELAKQQPDGPRPPKRPRGNFGFFDHVAQLRLHLPANPKESR